LDTELGFRNGFESFLWIVSHHIKVYSPLEGLDVGTDVGLDVGADERTEIKNRWDINDIFYILFQQACLLTF